MKSFLGGWSSKILLAWNFTELFFNLFSSWNITNMYKEGILQVGVNPRKSSLFSLPNVIFSFPLDYIILTIET